MKKVRLFSVALAIGLAMATSYAFSQGCYGPTCGGSLALGLVRSAVAQVFGGQATTVGFAPDTTVAAGTNYNLFGQSYTGATANTAGGAVIIGPGLGTGNVSTNAGYVGIQRGFYNPTTTAAYTAQLGVLVCPTRLLSTTSATTQEVGALGLISNRAGSVKAFIGLTCSDGTNFNTTYQEIVGVAVNKAGAYTPTSVPGAESSANNSGSCTIGATATAAGNLLSINVTPVFTTIVPTSVVASVVLFGMPGSSNMNLACN